MLLITRFACLHTISPYVGEPEKFRIWMMTEHSIGFLGQQSPSTTAAHMCVRYNRHMRVVYAVTVTRREFQVVGICG